MGKPERCLGLLGSQNARPNLLQRGSCKHFFAYLFHEDEAGAGRKIEGGDQRGDRIGARNKELPALAPGAMCYMMSKQQYLNDGARNWHPHVMFLVARGDAAKSWGAESARLANYSGR